MEDSSDTPVIPGPDCAARLRHAPGTSDAAHARRADWHGYAVAAARPVSMLPARGTTTAIATGWQIELTGAAPVDFEALAQAMFGIADAASETYMLVQEDAANGIFRAIAIAGDRMIGALLVDRRRIDIDRDWLVARLGTQLGATERFRVLAGRPSGSRRPYGSKVCTCCDVGQNEIVDAIAAGCRSVGDVGIATRAGTNCGRCQPDIARVIESART